ncbi:hypothetical protein [Compostimonas suwonensis]|uniref:Uncharacterized protein n=1 Tax=Compostimonas suwonensis TaxID=1048394 RepID=A0A2M9BUZ3_9MICO|nr:hypothetical protein [Compostimonas suwonensis]PJJ61712.1 hypothetical protein CLV54_2662 [Compostimonas suwonensis]
MADYELARSTEELAGLSEIVAKGVIVDIQAGPVAGLPDDDFSDIEMIVVALGEAELVQGKLPAESDGRVYFPMISPGDPKEFAKNIPLGSKVVLYANRIVNTQSDGDIPLSSPDAGRPKGQPVFRASHPQGLIIDVSPDGSGELVWPEALRWASAPIENTLPGGKELGSGEPAH